MLRKHKRKLKRDGKRFNETTLIPVLTSTAATGELQARQSA
jgi:hypothetical protein